MLVEGKVIGLPLMQESPPLMAGECQEDLIARDKTSLDIFWLKDNSLTDLDNLPGPDVLALDIVENLAAGLENFRAIAAILNSN